MKGVTGCVLGAVLLALGGGVLLALGRFDRQIARAQQDLATLQDVDPEAAFAGVESYYEYASLLPWIEGGSALNDVRARKAAMLYWQRHYDRIIPAQGDPIADIPADNVELQLIAANAVFRTAQAQAKDKTSVLRALDAGINAYLSVLKNTDGEERAAYNYEYLVRLRDDIDNDRRPPRLSDTGDEGPSGQQGGPPKQNPEDRQFKILVPLDSEEMDKGLEPGKGGVIDRKG
jgi:hypothetical protein